MIDIESKSYPYLAIAQHYGVSYAEVLRFSDWLEDLDAEVVITTLEWQYKVFDLWIKSK